MTTCANVGGRDNKFTSSLSQTIFKSEQIIDAGCPVWVIDTQTRDSKSDENPLWDNKHPNYLFVRFFEADHIEELEECLKSQCNDSKCCEKDSVVLQNIRDQVSEKFECALQFPVESFSMYLSSLIPPLVDSLSE
jgi:hypothetical protein